MDASDGRLTARVRGEIGLEEGVLVIRRIRVHYRLQAPEESREVVERVHGFHTSKCPVYRSLRRVIEITTSYELLAE